MALFAGRPFSRISSIPFSYKVILVFLLLMNLSFLLIGYMAKQMTEETLLSEKRTKLLTLTSILDSRLGPAGYAGILKADGAQALSREETIQRLNEALRAPTDEIGEAEEGLGVGFYSLAVDAIITYGPSSKFQYTVGKSIPPDHPGRTVMKTRKPLVMTGTMVRGDILNAMSPLIRDGEVIGYAWANELTTGVTDQLEANAKNFLFIMAGCFIITCLVLLLFARRTMRDMDLIIRGVLAMRSDLTKRVTGVEGELGRVADSINEMAEDVDRANEETKRAVFVLQQVMNKLDATVYVSDQETYTLLYVNEYLRNTLGEEVLEGRPCYEALYGSTAPCDSCPRKYLVDEKGDPVLTPYRSEVYNPGSGRNFLITARLVPWHDGRMHYMEVGTDVTDRKALAVAEAANLAQRDFLARMSHEIRTPMNGVLGMTRLAIQASPPPEQLVYLKKIQSSASLLLGIINDILDFSKIEAGKLTIEDHVFSPRETVENIRELILPRVQENNLDLIIELDDSVPPYINADGLRLSQILLNLLGNAAKFTLEGSVRLTVRLGIQENQLPHLECAVTDTGIGMSDKELKALFRPFTQADGSTSRKFGGTGLGLSISKALVELMGGEITVTSKAGEGSTFAFYIPVTVVDEEVDEAQPHDQPWRDATFEGCRLLLVEDNEINREIAQACFEELGATVEVAENGQVALEAFLANDYDLIFMDVRMPVMDGLEATRQIRASNKEGAKTVPIVAMTANAMREDREASQQAGMDAHIAKPFEMLEIKRVLYLHLKGPEKEKTTAV